MENDNKILLKKKIGQKIKDIRISKKLSRQQVADDLDMSLANYGYIERGEIDMSISCLVDIAKEFDVPLDDLLNLKEKNVLNFNGIQNDGCHNYQITSLSAEVNEIMLKNELEKAQLLLKERDKEVNYLKEENHSFKRNVRLDKIKR
jgi:transcriptional regulator with XRE-family HTH domain